MEPRIMQGVLGEAGARPRRGPGEIVTEDEMLLLQPSNGSGNLSASRPGHGPVRRAALGEQFVSEFGTGFRSIINGRFVGALVGLLAMGALLIGMLAVVTLLASWALP